MLAANLGDDADTTAAVTGQLAGAVYGYEAIPLEWRRQLAQVLEIVRLADQLSNMAQGVRPYRRPPGA